jgi:hypothetical protein
MIHMVRVVVVIDRSRYFNGFICAIVYLELSIGAHLFIKIPVPTMKCPALPLEIRCPFEHDTDGCDQQGFCEERDI